MDEIWITMEEFPMYKLNNFGTIINRNTGRILRESLTRAGDVKIGLVMDGIQYSRSVKRLVAESFVEGRDDIFDTPIHLDGDQRNNRSDNLMWRPRWFAWKYTRQFVEITIHHTRGPVVDVRTRDRYRDFFEAAIINGILVRDIWSSILVGKPTFPTNQLFEIVK